MPLPSATRLAAVPAAGTRHMREERDFKSMPPTPVDQGEARASNVPVRRIDMEGVTEREFANRPPIAGFPQERRVALVGEGFVDNQVSEWSPAQRLQHLASEVSPALQGHCPRARRASQLC